MIEQLPIAINASNELLTIFPQLNAVTNRLEAQFNFQSMLANWYGDEENVVLINMQLQTPVNYRELHLKHKDQPKFTLFSDDVFSITEEQGKPLLCIVAITNSELALLGTQEKLLAPYLQKKLHKVLNLIAEQLTLAALTPLSSN